MIKVLGAAPKGERLQRIQRSANYKNGSFQNLSPTDVTLQNASLFSMMRKFMNKPKTTVPPALLHPVRTELRDIKADTPVIVWFGHSSYMIKSQDKTILVDPVFSGNASPVSFFARAFPGADAYTAADFGHIDLLVITHDHYDHLDYKTIAALKPKIKKVCTSLGVGAHLEYWGLPAGSITELDWWEGYKPYKDMEITAAPARHFSGRSFKRNQTLWSSFVLNLHGHRLYLGGDSGYDTHFKAIGEKYGPFDIALLEAGQYGENWPYIHMMPEDTVKAATELQAKVLMPIHWGKFTLALHDWDEPITRVLTEAAKRQVQVTTPQIGAPVILDKNYPDKQWWK